jgi:hypothetical protein
VGVADAVVSARLWCAAVAADQVAILQPEALQVLNIQSERFRFHWHKGLAYAVVTAIFLNAPPASPKST